MVKCHNCGTDNLDSSQFCDECGTKLIRFQQDSQQAPLYVPPVSVAEQVVAADEPSVQRAVQVTSIGVPPINGDAGLVAASNSGSSQPGVSSMNAKLVIERGDGPGTEFRLSGADATIGRWDADNGVFPDVDLDSHDQEAKVSRRHARIKMLDGNYVVEDLGSTNGTYVNRGRRLLPGMPQVINDGDEVIVGKTFLRIHISK